MKNFNQIYPIMYAWIKCESLGSCCYCCDDAIANGITNAAAAYAAMVKFFFM